MPLDSSTGLAPRTGAAIATFARTIWGESRGEGDPGMWDVACVIMNRVAHPRWWGHDIISVCRDPWQFSCWNPSDPNLAKLETVTEADPQFADALDIAQRAAAGKLPDRTNGATSYYDKRMAVPPKWAVGRTPCYAEGHHLFFRDA